MRACSVCLDNMGFLVRPCPDCGRQKVRTRSGRVIGIPAEAAAAYHALMQTLGEGQTHDESGRADVNAGGDRKVSRPVGGDAPQ